MKSKQRGSCFRGDKELRREAKALALEAYGLCQSNVSNLQKAIRRQPHAVSPFVPVDGSPVLQAPHTPFLGLISLPEGNQGPSAGA